MLRTLKLYSSKLGSSTPSSLRQISHAGILKQRASLSGNVGKTVLIAGAVSSGVALYMYNTKGRAFATESKAALDPKEWKSEIQNVNHNTHLFRFDLGGADRELGLTVASCLITKAPIGEDGKDVIRPYTPVSSNDQKGHLDLIVKTYPQGVMSKHIGSMKPGDFLEMKGPIQKIAYSPNMKKNIGMIAGGSGITPMLQVTREILKNPNDKTQVTLIFANIAEEDILCKKEFDDLAKKHDNFRVYYVLEKPPKNWNQGVGYVNSKVAKELMPPPSKDNLIMVCGPPGMMKAVSGDKAPDKSQGELDGILKQLGYSSEMVFKF